LDLIWDGLWQAIRLILSGDREILSVSLLSLAVPDRDCPKSFAGVPLGTFLALSRFPGQRFIIKSGQHRHGDAAGSGRGVRHHLSLAKWSVGVLHLLYTPRAMVIAQCVIAMPIVAGLTMAAIQQLNPKLRLQILALGASRWQMVWLLLQEARLPLLAVVMAGFGAVISEIGASMMVGGTSWGRQSVNYSHGHETSKAILARRLRLA